MAENFLIEWEDFRSGGSKADLCVRAIIGHAYGYDETLHKHHMCVAVGTDKEHCYFSVIDGNPATKRDCVSGDLASAKSEALGHLAEHIGDWFRREIFNRAVQKSTASAF